MLVTKTLRISKRDLVPLDNSGVDDYVRFLESRAGGRIDTISVRATTPDISDVYVTVEVDVPVRKGRVMKPYPFR